MPSPVDLRIWLLSRTLGWPGRRIAGEVGVSQPTVVRTLERLTKEPPTDQEMQDFMNVSATPPRGLPAITGRIRTRPGSRSLPAKWIYATCAILVTLALVAIMAGFAVKLLNPQLTQPPAGQVACMRFAPDGSIAGTSSPVHGNCPHGQFIVTIVQNP